MREREQPLFEWKSICQCRKRERSSISLVFWRLISFLFWCRLCIHGRLNPNAEIQSKWSEATVATSFNPFSFFFSNFFLRALADWLPFRQLKIEFLSLQAKNNSRGLIWRPLQKKMQNLPEILYLGLISIPLCCTECLKVLSDLHRFLCVCVCDAKRNRFLWTKVKIHVFDNVAAPGNVLCRCCCASRFQPVN